MNEGQKTSIGIGKDGLTITGNQSDYTGMIIGGVVLVVILGMVALIKWGPALLGKIKNGNGKKPETGSLNGKARLEDLHTDLRDLSFRVDKLNDTVELNTLGLETYKREVDKKIAEKDAIDVEQREKIKALERTVYKDA